MNFTLKDKSNKCRNFPRTTGFDASPATSQTSSTEKTPPTASTAGVADTLELNVDCAIAVTSFSSQVPAAFQTDPALCGWSGSTAAAASVAILVGLNSCLGSLVGFHSRCLYQVIFSSSLSTTFSSSFFLASCFGLGGAGFDASSFFGGAGFVHVRLWNCQSSFWHFCVQYTAFLHWPHRSGLLQSSWQFQQWGFSAGLLSLSSVLAAAGFSSSESTMLSNLE
mmetsp:Transcript_40451/g.73128  ORF Transcript_40451/g.73128 Transcript_40451/m.73128 type:complete len:223 (-) Transcript_40451:146-814(-)